MKKNAITTISLYLPDDDNFLKYIIEDEQMFNRH